MTQHPAGARIEIGALENECVVDVGPGPTSLAAGVIVTNGAGKHASAQRHGPPWRLPLDTGAGAVTQIIVYMDDERQIGRVEDRAPINITVGGVTIELETRDDRHGVVIAAEVYDRGGKRMLRVRGDGHRHGIAALCRREGIPDEVFQQPRRQDPPEPSAQPRQRPRHHGQAIGSGSGVIVAPEHVVTNAHVVSGSRTQTVRYRSNDHDGRILSVDEQHDLALVHVPGLNGTPMIIEEAGASFPGEEVIAAGYPLRDILNDDIKITRGNVSSLRGAHGDVTMMQFTAPIGSGSSGGAITNLRGRLVGVVCSALSHEAVRSGGGVSEGVNFAVKAALVSEMLAAAGIDVPARPPVGGSALPAGDLSRLLQHSVVAITLS